MKKIDNNKKLETPKISSFNKHLINSRDNTKDSDSNNNINKVIFDSPHNHLKNKEYFDKEKKYLIKVKLANTDTKKNDKNKKEGKNIINKSINFDDSDGLLTKGQLPSLFKTERKDCHSHSHNQKNNPKEKLIQKTEKNNNINNTNNNINIKNIKEKESNISVGDLFCSFPLEKNNRQMDEKISSATYIQSIWRRYQSKKKLINIKWTYLIDLLLKFINIRKIKIFKKAFKRIKYFAKKKKNYYKKLLKNNEITFGDELIPHANTLRLNNVQIKENNNKIGVLKKKKKHKSTALVTKYKKKKKDVRMELPFSIEKYIKQKLKKMYYYSFLLKIKTIYKDKLKVEQKKVILKLINKNDKKIIKHYMNRYQEKVIMGKTKQNIYCPLIKIKPKYCSSKRVNATFSFKKLYKQNILKGLINKYGYISYVKKYYILWKKKTEEEKKNKIIDKNEDNAIEDKKYIIKKLLKIKKTKKNTEEKYNFNDSSIFNDSNNFNDFNNRKEDTICNISGISLNKSCDNGSVSDGMESENMIKHCFTTANRKMKIKKVVVDQNYYQYIEKINNFNTNLK